LPNAPNRLTIPERRVLHSGERVEQPELVLEPWL